MKMKSERNERREEKRRKRKMKSYSAGLVQVRECEIQYKTPLQSNATVFPSFFLLGFCVIASPGRPIPHTQ